MEISMEVNLLPWTSMEASMGVGGNFHGIRSNGSRWTLMEVLWKELEVCDTRGSRWKYVGVYRSSWKLSRDMFVEAAIDRSKGGFHFHRQWKPCCTSMEASTVETLLHFHGSFHYPMEINLLPPTCMEISMQVNLLPPTSMEVNWLPLK